MWEIIVTMLDEATKLARIIAVRTDPITDEVYRYRCEASIDSPPHRAAILDKIQDEYEQYEMRQERIENTIAGLGDTATNAMNAWEIIRNG
jgi:hypothetical protein